MMSDFWNVIRNVLDWISVGALVATLLAWLPHITAVAVLIWTCLRIYETLLSVRLKRRELNSK